MEVFQNSNRQLIQTSSQVPPVSASGFIEANTQEVSLKHLQKDCESYPVFVVFKIKDL